MTGLEIREKIQKNNKLIEEQTLSTFILNKKVQEALAENEMLRRMCPHEYDATGYCIYCDTELV